MPSPSEQSNDEKEFARPAAAANGLECPADDGASDGTLQVLSSIPPKKSSHEKTNIPHIDSPIQQDHDGHLRFVRVYLYAHWNSCPDIQQRPDEANRRLLSFWAYFHGSPWVCVFRDIRRGIQRPCQVARRI